MRVDVAILGAGPAGAAAALALAPHHRVAVIDGRRRASPVGETLPGAGRRLLADMGLWEAFTAGPHLPCHARRSRWGSQAPHELGALRDLDGPAWLIDRTHLERTLRAAAHERGARVVAGRAVITGHDPGSWQITGPDADHPVLRARVMIDATGRRSFTARHTGAARVTADRLTCAWTTLTTSGPSAPLAYVESASDGWWYTTPLGTGNRRLLAFHTDSSPHPVRSLAHGLATKAQQSVTMREELSGTILESTEPVRFRAAGSSRISHVAGPDWLAIGDTAMAFDPLSSQGLFHALYSGFTCTSTVDRLLAGDADAPVRAQRAADSIWAAYCAGLAAHYATERRWSGDPFWRRRQNHAGQARPAMSARHPGR